MADFVLPMAPLTILPRRERKPIFKFLEFVRRSTDSGQLDSLAPIPGPNIQRDGCAERMSDVISGMKHVEELNVMDFALSLPKYDSVAIFDLDFLLRVALVSAWTTFGSTLRRLSINMLPPYPLYVFLFDLTFPTLEVLDVKLPVTGVHGRLVSFINNHHPTLQSLKLFIVSTPQPTGSDPCLSLLGIRRLQHLKKVHFWYDVPARSPLPATSGLHHVLATHSNGIRELRLDLHFPKDHCRQSSTKLKAEPLFHVALPHLESLELGSSCFSDCKQISVYLSQFTRSLMVFNLERTKLPYNDVVMLMNAFPEQNQLRYLTISVEHLTPELLDFLAMKLHDLEHLHLMFQSICVASVNFANEELVSIQSRFYP
jgi:hypothetical protein